MGSQLKGEPRQIPFSLLGADKDHLKCKIECKKNNFFFTKKGFSNIVKEAKIAKEMKIVNEVKRSDGS